MNDGEFQEEILNWDAEHFTGPGGVIFELGWQGTWELLLRADFRLFDEYQYRHAGAARFDFPIHAWHFANEHFNKPEMIQMWSEWTTKDFDYGVMEGMGHLTCFYNKDLKRQYFQKVADLMKGYVEQ